MRVRGSEWVRAMGEFAIPVEIRAMAYQNKAKVYGLMFTAAETPVTILPRVLLPAVPARADEECLIPFSLPCRLTLAR